MHRFIFSTRRLRLRQLSHDDLDFVATMLGDAEVMRFYPGCYSRDESKEWIQRQLDRYRQFGHGLWLVESKESGEPIGQVGLSMQRVDGTLEPEIGYLIHRPYWRRGYASEAAAATRDYAFLQLVLPHVISLIRPINLPSRGVAGKIGLAPAYSTIFANLEHTVFVQINPAVYSESS